MALLEARGITVRFGGHVAVDAVDLEVEAGAVTGLIGPNGAGKTTTFNVLTGLQETTAGQVLLAGDDITRLATHKRARRGLARTFQKLEVFSSLTVWDNVLVATEIHGSFSGGGRRHHERTVAAVIDRVGLGAVAGERVDSLPTGQCRLVELARALAIEPRVLLLDEPASGLDDGETRQFADLLLDLVRDGLAILMVEHDVPLVMEVCEDISVLDFGRVIARGTPEEIQSNQDVLDAYLGSELG
ncbi:MAG: ABC transporter ATP-binding protein [Acidimicrobiales bacterium]|nr:ABC transporter ATP-binding protein [Acidimicrobiales bacterium]MCB9372195.1 ABC transporter ATP-binding protein [Microthrixaceae bacterium]